MNIDDDIINITTFCRLRAYGGVEIDMLLEYDGRYYPMEIKAKSNPSRRDTSGITAFRKRHPELSIAPGLIVAPMEKSLQLSENDYAIPWDLKLGA